MNLSVAKTATLVLGAIALALSLWALEAARSGIETRAFSAGDTPATLYTGDDPKGPLVIVAHGFAGSRPLMQAFSLTLARAGYRVAAFDFEGHGRNPTPMSGDVSRIDGTTALLVEETRRVIAAAREVTAYPGPIALVGHSMASDIVIRAAEGDPTVAAIVAVSMYSEAVTATYPERLLIVSGQWEPHLRDAGVEALRLVDPDAREGMTVRDGDVVRSARVAPFVEHVGVLYAPLTLTATRNWLDTAFGRESTAGVARIGVPLAAMMAALVALTWPLAGLLRQGPVPAEVPRRTFWLAVTVPAGFAALVTGFVRVSVFPVLIADAMALHFAVMGWLQLAILARARILPRPGGWGGIALLLIWGLAIFGLLLDRYGATFLPIPSRLPVIALLALGTVPFMLADAALTRAGHGRLWRRIAARLAYFASLSGAIALDPERLLFIATVFPVLILFFAVHGLMGRWVGQHAGAFAAGAGLGLILAWALGVTFPMFSA